MFDKNLEVCANLNSGGHKFQMYLINPAQNLFRESFIRTGIKKKDVVAF